ncbi:MAG TPA: hypothetical protein VMT53_23325 [Terriglobales bacterium]|nr:hypothetical protein [Terriglobales bacterium]
MPNVSPICVREEELLLRQQRRGGVMKTVGKVLLWFDLIIVCFAYMSIRDGSYFFWWWFLGEFILGAGLMVYGTHVRSAASRRLAQMSPTTGTWDLQNEAEQQRRAS